jgi:SOS-response transcriptional repressor LexA
MGMGERIGMIELTKKQQAVYDFIVAYLCEHHRPPTRVEIRDGMGFASGNSAQEYLWLIEKKGAITLLDGDRNIHLNNVRLEVIHEKQKK